jgi:hypothetical protein
MSEKQAVLRMGQLRYKYLDNANMLFAQGNHIQAKGYVDAFLETIDDNSTAANKIRESFKTIEDENRELTIKLNTVIKDLGWLEKKDAQERGKAEIEINSIQDKKNACWTVSMSEGLFND